MPPRLPLPQSTLNRIPEYQRSVAYQHGSPQNDASIRSRGKYRDDKLREEARRFALTTADPSTQSRKLQKRLLYDYGDLYYEDTDRIVRRKDAAADQGKVVIPPLIMPAAESDADVVVDAASGRGEVEIPLPPAMPPKAKVTDQSLLKAWKPGLNTKLGEGLYKAA